jgi:hypothetical protein
LLLLCTNTQPLFYVRIYRYLLRYCADDFIL